MWDRFPPRMRRAITTTLEEAGRRGLGEASTEDLLLAITRDPECAAMFMFEHAGVPASELARRLDSDVNRDANGDVTAGANGANGGATGSASAANAPQEASAPRLAIASPRQAKKLS